MITVTMQFKRAIDYKKHLKSNKYKTSNFKSNNKREIVGIKTFLYSIEIY